MAFHDAIVTPTQMSARSTDEYYATPRDSARDSWAQQNAAAPPTWAYGQPPMEQSYAHPSHTGAMAPAQDDKHGHGMVDAGYYGGGVPHHHHGHVAESKAYYSGGADDGDKGFDQHGYASHHHPQNSQYHADAKGVHEGVHEAWGAPAGPTDNAGVSESDIEDIFSYARHNRVDEVCSA